MAFILNVTYLGKLAHNTERDVWLWWIESWYDNHCPGSSTSIICVSQSWNVLSALQTDAFLCKSPRRQRHQWKHSRVVPEKPASLCFHESHFFPDTGESARIVLLCSKHSLCRQSRYGRLICEDKGVWRGKGVWLLRHQEWLWSYFSLLSPEVNTSFAIYFAATNSKTQLCSQTHCILF